MPAPAVYVLAVVGAVGAAIAFKEFVYEPVIAPRVERWAAEFLAKREAKRRRLAEPVPVSLPLRRRRRRSDSLSSDTSDEGDNKDVKDHKLGEEEMQERDLMKWRNGVVGSGSEASQGLLRKRTATKPKSSDRQERAYTPLSPSLVHVIIDPTDSSPPTSASQSTFPSRVSTPPSLARVSSLQSETRSSGSPGPSLSSSPQHGARSTTLGRTPSPAARSTTLGRTPSPAAEQARSTTLGRTPSPAVEASAPASQVTEHNVLTASAVNVNTNAGNPPHTPAISELTGLDFTSPPSIPIPVPNSNLLSSSSTSPTSPFGSYTSSWSTQTETPTPTVEHPFRTTSPFTAQNIPSLSQIYPQEIEAEQGIELVSPPSSRSESPFMEVDGERSSRTSSVMSSPRVLSPLGSELGFERVRSPLASQDDETTAGADSVGGTAVQYQPFSPATSSRYVTGAATNPYARSPYYDPNAFSPTAAASAQARYSPTTGSYQPEPSWGSPLSTHFSPTGAAPGDPSPPPRPPYYPTAGANSSGGTPTAPRYYPTTTHFTHLSPTTPNFSPASPISPGYSPTSPPYSPVSPRYSPTTPNFSLTSPRYSPTSPSPRFSPSSPQYSPYSPPLAPERPESPWTSASASASAPASVLSSPNLSSQGDRSEAYYSLHNSLHEDEDLEHDMPSEPPIDYPRSESPQSSRLSDVDYLDDLESESGMSGWSSAREGGAATGNGRGNGMGRGGRRGSESEGSEGWMDDF